MPSSLRRATVITLLLGTFLVPALLEAKTPARSLAPVGRSISVTGFFDMVWELLANLRESGAGSAPVSSFATKNGGMLDPNGQALPAPGDSTTSSENGGMLDPNG